MNNPTRVKVLPSGARLMLASGDYVDIEGSGFGVETEVERAYFDRAAMADMTWEQEHGDHVHRFVGKPRKAEVTDAHRDWKHVECDGSCGGVCGDEGYDEPIWLCIHDGSELDPRYVDDSEARNFGIPISATHHYTLTLPGHSLDESIEGASLVLDDGRTLDLPPMFPAEMSFSSSDTAPLVRYVGTARSAIED